MDPLVQLLYGAVFSAFAGCQAALLLVRAAGHPQSTHKKREAGGLPFHPRKELDFLGRIGYTWKWKHEPRQETAGGNPPSPYESVYPTQHNSFCCTVSFSRANSGKWGLCAAP